MDRTDFFFRLAVLLSRFSDISGGRTRRSSVLRITRENLPSMVEYSRKKTHISIGRVVCRLSCN